MAMQILATMKGQFQAKELLRRCRGFSQVADRETIAHEIESPIPKMPLFDYAPPPYDGPSAAEILQKRKQFLSPSMFYFYNNTPVSPPSPNRILFFLSCSSTYQYPNKLFFLRARSKIIPNRMNAGSSEWDRNKPMQEVEMFTFYVF